MLAVTEAVELALCDVLMLSFVGEFGYTYASDPRAESASSKSLSCSETYMRQ